MYFFKKSTFRKNLMEPFPVAKLEFAVAVLGLYTCILFIMNECVGENIFVHFSLLHLKFIFKKFICWGVMSER